MLLPKKNIKKIMLPFISLVDDNLARLYLSHYKEQNSLISFYFHGIFSDQTENNLEVIDPRSNRNITVGNLRHLIEYFLNQDYKFVSPSDILSGLKNDKNILLTFDDGYFNNIIALPILKEYEVPAVFFISTNHVKHNKSFWWDVIYRERRKSGASQNKIMAETEHLKSKRHNEIEMYINTTFGENALKPVSDIDRPFTSKELKEFAKEQYVYIGNHTSDHAILTSYTYDEISDQIEDAQNTLYEITGIKPSSISYPSGRYSDEVIRSSKDNGLKIGFAIDGRKNYFPINGNTTMRLSRFSLNGNEDIVRQCKIARSDLRIKNIIKNNIRSRH